MTAKPGMAGKSKPTVETKTPAPQIREVVCGEIALPVWETHGGPKAEPPRK